MTRSIRGYHEHYTDKYRHFCPKSQSYTGADSLIHAERDGWHILRIVYEQQIPLGLDRTTSIFYFKLTRGDEKMIMAVTRNPFVERLVAKNKMIVLPYAASRSRNRRSRFVWRSIPYNRRPAGKPAYVGAASGQ